MDNAAKLRRSLELVGDIHQRGVALRAQMHTRYSVAVVEDALRRKLIRTRAPNHVPLCTLAPKGSRYVGIHPGYERPAANTIKSHIAQRVVIDDIEASGGHFVARLGRNLLRLVNAAGDTEFVLVQHDDFHSAYLARRVASLRSAVAMAHATLVIYRYKPLDPRSKVHKELLVELRSMQPLLERAHPDARTVLHPHRKGG